MCEIIERETAAARERGERLRGVFHAFSEDVETYKRLKACGDFLFGIGGVVTFKKSALAETVREMSPEDLLLKPIVPTLPPCPIAASATRVATFPISAHVWPS